jgi:hypothetical protein
MSTQQSTMDYLPHLLIEADSWEDAQALSLLVRPPSKKKTATKKAAPSL